MRVLTCLGDATSMHTHGGLPYHFLDAGMKAGFIDYGWPLKPDKFRGARLLWNARHLLTHGAYGGYQYTESFLRDLTRQVLPAGAEPDEIVSIFPLLPWERSQSTKVTIYIDATLGQNFDDYGIAKKIDSTIVADALARERAAYHNAERVICRSRVAAKSVVENYGVDAEKVHIVPGGANIIGDPGPSRYNAANLALTPVRLAFIGKDWRRKNLAFVLKIADVLRARGIAAEVVASGFDPRTGPRHSHLRCLGFIDKGKSLNVFVKQLRSCHFNCLFSRAEAFGLSNRESLRLGVPVLASNVGGIPDTVPEGCGHLFDSDAGEHCVADVIERYVRNSGDYWKLRENVSSRAEEFTWAEVVRKMQAIWAGSEAFLYHASPGHV